MFLGAPSLILSSFIPDLSSVQTDPEVTIRKLENPFRHQVAGGPSQQTLNFSQGAVSEGT